MLHTKFRENRPAGSRGAHIGHVTQMPRTNFRSPYPRRLHIKFGFDRACGLEKKMFEIVYDGRRRRTTDDDGRRPDHQYPISSP